MKRRVVFRLLYIERHPVGAQIIYKLFVAFQWLEFYHRKVLLQLPDPPATITTTTTPAPGSAKKKKKKKTVYAPLTPGKPVPPKATLKLVPIENDGFRTTHTRSLREVMRGSVTLRKRASSTFAEDDGTIVDSTFVGLKAGTTTAVSSGSSAAYSSGSARAVCSGTATVCSSGSAAVATPMPHYLGDLEEEGTVEHGDLRAQRARPGSHTHHEATHEDRTMESVDHTARGLSDEETIEERQGDQGATMTPVRNLNADGISAGRHADHAIPAEMPLKAGRHADHAISAGRHAEHAILANNDGHDGISAGRHADHAISAGRHAEHAISAGRHAEHAVMPMKYVTNLDDDGVIEERFFFSMLAEIDLYEYRYRNASYMHNGTSIASIPGAASSGDNTYTWCPHGD